MDTDESSATHSDVAFSNAKVHNETVARDVKPGSSVAAVVPVGSDTPNENTPEKVASRCESVPYSTPL